MQISKTPIIQILNQLNVERVTGEVKLQMGQTLVLLLEFMPPFGRENEEQVLERLRGLPSIRGVPVVGRLVYGLKPAGACLCTAYLCAYVCMTNLRTVHPRKYVYMCVLLNIILCFIPSCALYIILCFLYHPVLYTLSCAFYTILCFIHILCFVHPPVLYTPPYIILCLNFIL